MPRRDIEFIISGFTPVEHGPSRASEELTELFASKLAPNGVTRKDAQRHVKSLGGHAGVGGCTDDEINWFLQHCIDDKLSPSQIDDEIYEAKKSKYKTNGKKSGRIKLPMAKPRTSEFAIKPPTAPEENLAPSLEEQTENQISSPSPSVPANPVWNTIDAEEAARLKSIFRDLDEAGRRAKEAASIAPLVLESGQVTVFDASQQAIDPALACLEGMPAEAREIYLQTLQKTRDIANASIDNNYE